LVSWPSLSPGKQEPVLRVAHTDGLQHRNPGQGFIRRSLWACWGHAPAHNLHRCAAARTRQGRANFHPGLWWHGGQLEHPLQQCNQPFAVGVQKAKVARSPQAFGQNMLHEQPQKGGTADGACRHLAGFAVAIAKAHASLFTAQNVFFLDDAPVEIAPQIDQGFHTGADTLAIDHPFFWKAWQRQAFAGDGRQQLGPKYFGQGLVVEQVVAFAFAGLGSKRSFNPALPLKP